MKNTDKCFSDKLKFLKDKRLRVTNGDYKGLIGWIFTEMISSFPSISLLIPDLQIYVLVDIDDLEIYV